MPVLAIVSKLTEEERQSILEVLPQHWTIRDCTAERSRLIENGDEVEIVYGMVRPQDIGSLPNLKWVQTTWTGAENILHPAMCESDVVLTNLRGQCSHEIAEHVLGSMLYLSRCFRGFGDAYRKRQWRPDPLRITSLRGSPALILGTGAIGCVVAQSLALLGVHVAGVNTSGNPQDSFRHIYTFESVREDLSSFDHVINCLPNTPKTRHIVNEEFLSLLKEGVHLYNIGRGETMDEEAVLRHLQNGKIGAMVLDVVQNEKNITSDHPFYGHDNVLLTGHTSCLPANQPPLAAKLFIENLERWFDGGRDALMSVVDKTKGY